MQKTSSGSGSMECEVRTHECCFRIIHKNEIHSAHSRTHTHVMCCLTTIKRNTNCRVHFHSGPCSMYSSAHYVHRTHQPKNKTKENILRCTVKKGSSHGKYYTYIHRFDVSWATLFFFFFALPRLVPAIYYPDMAFCASICVATFCAKSFLHSLSAWTCDNLTIDDVRRGRAVHWTHAHTLSRWAVNKCKQHRQRPNKIFAYRLHRTSEREK